MLPSLMEQGVTVLLMSHLCKTPGMESFSDKVEEASDCPLPRTLRSHVTFKSPAVYIYTSGTTGGRMTLLFGFRFHVIMSSLWFAFSLQDPRCLRFVIFPGLPKAAVVNQNRLLTALAVLSSNGVTASDVIYVNLPLYHTAGFIVGFIGSFETGEITERPAS